MVQCDGCGGLSPLEGVLVSIEKHTEGRTDVLFHKLCLNCIRGTGGEREIRELSGSI
jgi:hypothetical protein